MTPAADRDPTAGPRRRLGVIGQPIAHSRSPAMHGAALAELGLAPQWSYEAIECSPEDFPALVGGLPRRGFRGVNVTIPHKAAALTASDRASGVASEIGAANTLSFDRGEIVADNTDAAGLLEALPEPPRDRRALVLGAGGSARAVVWALADQGARVAVWNRTQERAAELANAFGAEAIPAAEGLLPVAEFELIVNATSVGLEGGAGVADPIDALHLPADGLSDRHVVVDLVYGPTGTELGRLARRRGARFVDGLEVLVRQGAASLRIWTGLEPPIATMRRAAAERRDL